MVDFHTHILPGIDDGSKSVQQSLDMLRMESQQGITDVVLSSHFYASQNNVQQYLDSRAEALNKLTACWEPGLPRIHLGAEVQYFEGISVTEEIVDLRIEGTKLLLLEMPFSRWSDRVVQDVLTLNQRKDMQIILAHIDRYLGFQDPGICPYLVDCGILMQANASFFRGFLSRRRAVKMVQQGLIHFLGTDCHSMTNRAPDWTPVPEKILHQINQVSYFKDSQLVSL